MRDTDEQARQAQLRSDPRRDPTDPPPAHAVQAKEQPPSSPREDAPRDPIEAPAAPNATGETEARAEPAVTDEPPSSRRRALPLDVPPGAASDAAVITAADPRIGELEPLVATANWEGVLSVLGSEEQAGKLPPNLGLIYAVARKEHHIEKQEAGKKDTSEYDPNAVAIRCMAGIFGVRPESPIALVFGKRLMRSNPVSWQKKKAPPAPISVLIVALGLFLGAGIGWLLSFGYVELKLPFLP